MPSPRARHAVNPSLGVRWRHPCRHTVPQPARTPHQRVGRRSSESCLSRGAHQTWRRCFTIEQGASSTALTMHTDHLAWSLPAHRCGTLSGMDAAPEPTWTYLRRVLRWWAGKGPAAKAQRRVRCALTRQLVGAHLKAVCRAVRIRRGGDASRSNKAHPALLYVTYRQSRLVLAGPPSRDPERHGCRAGAYMDVLAACPAMVGGQGPRSKLAASSARRPHRLRDTP
ncbi:hypothetical protein GGR60_003861 [Xanthomonas arboricola]|nr:hypothetical protein [Xanthomonas euroxanthea]